MLGDNIKKLRNEMGLTQNELVLKAKELKGNSSVFSQAQLSKWEKNETIPSTENIELLSTILNCSKSELEKENKNKVKVDLMQIYEEAFELGKNFKENEVKLLLNKILDDKKSNKDRAKCYVDFFIKNAMPVPEFFIDIFSSFENVENDNEDSLLTAFHIGFWNGCCKNN